MHHLPLVRLFPKTAQTSDSWIVFRREHVKVLCVFGVFGGSYFADSRTSLETTSIPGASGESLSCVKALHSQALRNPWTAISPKQERKRAGHAASRSQPAEMSLMYVRPSRRALGPGQIESTPQSFRSDATGRGRRRTHEYDGRI